MSKHTRPLARWKVVVLTTVMLVALGFVLLRGWVTFTTARPHVAFHPDRVAADKNWIMGGFLSTSPASGTPSGRGKTGSNNDVVEEAPVSADTSASDIPLLRPTGTSDPEEKLFD